MKATKNTLGSDRAGQDSGTPTALGGVASTTQRQQQIVQRYRRESKQFQFGVPTLNNLTIALTHRGEAGRRHSGYDLPTICSPQASAVHEAIMRGDGGLFAA